MNKKIIMSGLFVLVLTAGMVIAAPMDVTVTGDVASGDLLVEIRGFNQAGNGVLVGQQGAYHEFHGIGGFNGTLTSSVGSYGELSTNTNFASQSAASFNLYGWQDFEVSGGNPGSRLRIGELQASAAGDTYAAMKVDLIGAMYIFKDRGPYTYPTVGTPPVPNPNASWTLKAGGANYDVYHSAQVTNKNDPTDIIGRTEVELYQQGGSSTDEGMLGVSAGWAFKTTQSGANFPESTTMYIRANGAGNYYQSGYGKNNLTYNGAILGGPAWMQTTGSFTSGFQFDTASASGN